MRVSKKNIALGMSLIGNHTMTNISFQLGGICIRSVDPDLQWMGAWPTRIRDMLLKYGFDWSITLQGWFVDISYPEDKEELE